uniref:Uncharacterized protein n=1 Tax=Oryza meridionalis TaxID=40149 RepID=A0A0E0E8C4_9ORYZ
MRYARPSVMVIFSTPTTEEYAHNVDYDFVLVEHEKDGVPNTLVQTAGDSSGGGGIKILELEEHKFNASIW